MSLPAPSAQTTALPSRVALLQATFEAVARHRMAGVPLLHPGLRVQAIGFERPAWGRGDWLEGALLTPWFLNLVRLPTRPLAAGQGAWLAAGAQAVRAFGAQHFDFTGAQEEGVGAFEVASLFSPVLDFADQRAAVATAQAALDLLRGRPVASAPAGPCHPAPGVAPVAAEGVAARRPVVPAHAPAAAGPQARTATQMTTQMTTQVATQMTTQVATHTADPNTSRPGGVPARRGFLFGRGA